jgi:hypothetical protein
LAINDYDTETLFLKANVLVSLQEYDTAADCCRTVLEVDPENLECRDLLKQLENN